MSLSCLQGQSQAEPIAAEEPVTLHAYSNLVQIPVLVLSDKRMRAEPIAPGQFTLSIDSGPRFAPRHVRQQGSDPMRLIVLLDDSVVTHDLIRTFGAALNDAAHSFTANDLVSVSFLHGRKLSHTSTVPITSRSVEQLTATVAREFQKASAEDAKEPSSLSVPHSTANAPLWDAVALTLGEFGTTQSRRVLLLVTEGKDDRSRTSLKDLFLQADNLGVTIFALRERSAADTRKNPFVLNRDFFTYAPSAKDGTEPLVTLTEATGGLTLETREHPLAEGFFRVIRLARERYIVDFVRPSKLAAGSHSVDVRIEGPKYFIRSAGIGVPVPDAKIASDPNTVPSDSSLEPPVGTRKALTH